MILTGRMIREARTLAGLTQADLAAAAGVALALIVRIEGKDGMVIGRKSDVASIRRVLKGAGIEFIPESDGGAAVRLRRDQT